MSLAIFPSLIEANLLHLAASIRDLEPWSEGFHLDIMDNHFVPNLTWGPAFINAIAAFSIKPLAIHLMVSDPASIIQKIDTRPHDVIFFHSKESNHDHALIKTIQLKNAKVGIAVSPTTPLSSITPIAHLIDELLLMSVVPGASGQQFLPDSLERLEAITNYKQSHNLSFVISMDGGINEKNIKTLVHKGCQSVAVASALFAQSDPIAAIKNLRQAAGN